MLEAPNHAPAAPVSNAVIKPQDKGLVATDADEAKYHKQNKKTTLTIVQEFPKKNQPAASENVSSMNLVQGKQKAGDVSIDDLGKKTTLTIVQDFPKKQAQQTKATNIEMVQGKQKEGDIKIETDEAKKTTLVISQDFAKKQAERASQATHNVEMV